MTVPVQQGQRRLVERDAWTAAAELSSAEPLDTDEHAARPGKCLRPLLHAAESLQWNENADRQAADVSVVQITSDNVCSFHW